jgi:competence ComEA-like helix-hairpin-helix protein
VPQARRFDHFRGRHYLVVVLLVLTLCAVVLYRLAVGWRPAGQGQQDSIVALRLDPNTASAQELAAIPGVGAGLAERIVAYRARQHAAGRAQAFDRLSDLDHVEGIGQGTLDTIGPYLHFPGDTP